MIDAFIVVLYLCGVVAFGLWLGRGKQSNADYFLGGRSIPWGALLLSIVATETSTVTFLSIPGIAAAVGGDFTFLQITIGYIVGRFFVVLVLLPLYFSGKPLTAYEVLQKRFGVLSRRAAATLFLITRNVSDALRLFLTALVLQIVLGLDLTTSVVIIGVVTIGYTFVGGARSVIWNDCIQFVIYMLGAVSIAVVIVRAMPGGYEQVLEFAASEHKFRVFDFSPGISSAGMTFWAGLAGGAFLTAATHGTDQLMVQRYLSAKSQKDASLALSLSGFIVALQFGVFLLIGVGLASFFGLVDGALAPDGVKNDQLLAYFVVHYMPAGLLGLTLAAVFAAAMSTLSSSLNSSAAAFCNDVYIPLFGSALDDTGQLRLGRMATIGFGILQTGIAIAFGLIGTDESTVANVLKVSGFATGPVLGLYFLAVFAPRVDQASAIAGFIAGVLALSWVATNTATYWAWYALFGSLLTFFFGTLISLSLRGMNRGGVKNG